MNTLRPTFPRNSTSISNAPSYRVATSTTLSPMSSQDASSAIAASTLGASPAVENEPQQLVSANTVNSGLRRFSDGGDPNQASIGWDQFQAYYLGPKLNGGSTQVAREHENADQLINTYQMNTEEGFNAIASRAGAPDRIEKVDFEGLIDNSQSFINPVAGGRVNHPFNEFRGYRADGSEKRHGGVDIPASEGTPVLASRGGEVVYSGSENGSYNGIGFSDYGNVVVVKHDDGTHTLYAHLQDGSLPYRAGDTVDQGDRIGGVGNTGRSFGAHLHFEVWEDANRRKIDPQEAVPELR